MKYVILIFSLTLLGCGSTPKYRMENCKKLYENIFECEKPSDKALKEVR